VLESRDEERLHEGGRFLLQTTHDSVGAISSSPSPLKRRTLPSVLRLQKSERRSHGTDAAIAAFHQGKAIRARIPLIKLIASAITIGTGGSAGREGPTAQISAGFGSILATLLHLDARDRRIALATGIGAGIGAIFRAPLGGAILAAEILYRNDLEVEAIIPALIASIVGYSIFGSWSGWHPIFATQSSLAFTSPPQLLYYAALGVLCGLVGLLYARGFYGITHIFHRLRLPNWLKPVLVVC
jgi:chloride channel protein, CIC family